MYAVIKTGGKQYKVAANDEIIVEKLDANEGDEHAFENVLMIGDGETVTLGEPEVKGAAVVGEVVDQGKGDKVIIFKKRQRSTYRRKKGHRQLETTIKITAILPEGVDVKKLKKADKKTKSTEKAVISSGEALKEKKAKKAAAPKVKAEPAVEAPVEAAPAPKAAAKKPAPKEAAPKKEAAPVPSAEPDDLTKLKGVGPAIAKKLVDAGITNFAQIAAFTPEDVDAFEEKLSFKGRITRDGWIEQAKELAADA